MSNPSWDPVKYMRFERERGLPLRDLLHRVMVTPKTAVDLGCGPGNSTAQLRRAFPKAQILGIDSDPAMLEQAEATGLNVVWRQGDVHEIDLAEKVDLMLSNACLHWVHGQAEVLPRWMEALSLGGQLAVQLPTHEESEVHQIMYEVAGRGPWKEKLAEIGPLFEVHTAEQYYDLLSRHAADVEVWTTTYQHALDDVDMIIDWIAGSALRPFLQTLEGEEREAFFEEFAGQTAVAYFPRESGRVLLPYKRIFFIATR